MSERRTPREICEFLDWEISPANAIRCPLEGHPNGDDTPSLMVGDRSFFCRGGHGNVPIRDLLLARGYTTKAEQNAVMYPSASSDFEAKLTQAGRGHQTTRLRL